MNPCKKLNKRPRNLQRVESKIRPISWWAWGFLVLASLAAYIAFMILDPKPDILLSSCMAANTAIMLWATYRLYQWDLLLSPMSLAVIGPSMMIYYTFGNLGARMAGEGRFGSNYGSLDYYPLAALLTTFGLALFCGFTFFLFKHQLINQHIRYQDLSWSPSQAVLVTLLAGGIVLYLSIKYPFINGYFSGVESTVDRWLFASYLFFVALAGLAGMSVMVKSKQRLSRIVGLLVLIAVLIMAVLVRSRTYLLGFIAFLVLAWVTLNPKKIKSILFIGAIVVLITFPLVTVIKSFSTEGQTSSIIENFQVLEKIDFLTLLDLNQASASIDVQYRVAGLEHPAALLLAYNRNAAPMYGSAFLAGVFSALPGFLRPSDSVSERQAILYQFRNYGMVYGDLIGVPLSSGLADLGTVLSPLIYLVISAFCVLLWRIGQISPQLYLACIVIWMRVEPMDLFWDDGLFSLRAMAFVWLILFILNKFIMPKRTPRKKTAVFAPATEMSQ